MALREEKKAQTAAAITDAAFQLFAERGYDAVTLADVAAAAGIAERTLYRYVTDKQELLFGEDAAWRSALSESLLSRPDGEGPVTAIRHAAGTMAALLEPRRDEMRVRHGVIAASPALTAREAIKHAAWAAAITDGLQRRGVPRRDARIASRLAVLAFEEAVERWLAPERRRRSLAAELQATHASLARLVRDDHADPDARPPRAPRRP